MSKVEHKITIPVSDLEEILKAYLALKGVNVVKMSFVVENTYDYMDRPSGKTFSKVEIECHIPNLKIF